MGRLTYKELVLINRHLNDISDTWADLWLLLHFMPVSVGRIIDLRYSDLVEGTIILMKKGRFKTIQLQAPYPAIEIILRRRMAYPGDTFVFQSHSNRVKFKQQPVTIIAFNKALKIASKDITDTIVTSKSAKFSFNKYTSGPANHQTPNEQNR